MKSILTITAIVALSACSPNTGVSIDNSAFMNGEDGADTVPTRSKTPSQIEQDAAIDAMLGTIDKFVDILK